MLMQQYLNNHRAYLHSKTKNDNTTPADTGGNTAGPSAAIPGPDDDDPGAHNSQDENESDVILSDMESD